MLYVLWAIYVVLRPSNADGCTHVIQIHTNFRWLRLLRRADYVVQSFRNLIGRWPRTCYVRPIYAGVAVDRAFFAPFTQDSLWSIRCRYCLEEQSSPPKRAQQWVVCVDVLSATLSSLRLSQHSWANWEKNHACRTMNPSDLKTCVNVSKRWC